MKTIYNSEYAQRYTILFKDAFEALEKHLGEDALTETEKELRTFTSLEEYFTRIGDLAKIHSENVAAADDNIGYSKYSKFLMLPLDEVYGSNVFSIDSNSRNIKIPSNFIQNGVSLVGDEMAETLIFEIDRFFDITDLVTTEIYIQWTNPAGDEGASKITMVDYQSKPGKLLFGWPLTTKVTMGADKKGTAGSLKFSVRFFKRNVANEVIYSLNTLPATVSIKQPLRPILDLEKDQYLDDPADLFASIIENGPISSGTPAEIPFFITNLESVYFLEDDGTVSMCAQAAAADSGVLTYSWYYVQSHIVDNKVVTENQTILDDKNGLLEYILSKDIEPVNNKKYFTKEGEGAFVPYFPAENDDTLPEIGADGSRNLYEEVSIYHVAWSEDNSVTGSYMVKVTNRAGSSEMKIMSKEAIIPWITEIAHTTDLPTDMFLTPMSEDEYTGRLAIVANAKVCDDIEVGDNLTYNYEWKFSGINEDSLETKEVESAPSLTVAEPGWYKVVSTAELNKEKMYVESQVCRVVKPVEAPVIEGYQPGLGDDPSAVTVSIAPGQIKVLKITVDETPFADKLYSDSLTYHWFRGNPDDDNNIEITVENKEPDVESVAGDTLTVKYVDETARLYYCVVRNELAGEIAEVESLPFYVI